MSNIQSLKRRIKSAKNIKQITKAMEMVAASKMRRAQVQALSSRAYARKLQATMRTIAKLSSDYAHPLLTQPESGKDLILLISTDRSLAGSLNTNLFRNASEYVDAHVPDRSTLAFMVAGQKGVSFALSQKGNLEAQFNNIPDPITYQDTLSISSMIIKGFLDGTYKSVTVLYMDFVSTLVQQFRSDVLLPIKPQDYIDPTEEYAADSEHDEVLAPAYTFEPSAPEILDWLLPYYVEMALYQIMLEAKASEHSARMVAMKNASENATEIISDLELDYNRSRQASITAEILDIATATMAAHA